MPWKETCPMDQRVAFIADWLRDEWTMSELAARCGISRKTGYKWVDRYTADRERGLAERSRAPKVHGRAMADEVRDAVIALRRSHRTGGRRNCGRCSRHVPPSVAGRRRAPWAIRSDGGG